MATSDNRIELHVKGFQDREREDIEAEIRAALSDVEAGRYDQELERIGISRDDLGGAESTSYQIEERQHLGGAEWVLVYIVARAGAKVGAKALTDVWSRIIFPRLEQRYGSGRIRRDPPPPRR